jgi:hypothetical protein
MINKKEFFKKFLVITAIITLLFIVTGFLSYQETANEYRSNVRNMQRMEAAAIESIIRNLVLLKQDNIELFMRQKEIKNFIQDQNHANTEALRQYITGVMTGLKYYFQFRILNLNGHEIFKMNYKNNRLIYIPQENYQDKSQRYYFKEAQKLTLGQVYVSNFDYNIEYGELERPVMPTLRLIAPVYINKIKKAYIVINYNRSVLMKSFAWLTELSGFNLYIVNNQKQYLYYLFNENNLDQFVENPQQDSGLMKLIFSSPDYFVKDYALFYKLKIPLENQMQKTENPAYLYVVLKLPKQAYYEHMRKRAKAIFIEFSFLYLIAMVIILIMFRYLRIGFYMSKSVS